MSKISWENHMATGRLEAFSDGVIAIINHAPSRSELSASETAGT